MFHVVQPYSSREFQNLQTIDLSYCKMLRQIQMASFRNVLNLKEDDLSGNRKLKEIKPHTFPRNLHLTRLSLSKTGRTSLTRKSVLFERLSDVSLSCTCDSDLLWLLKSPIHGRKCNTLQFHSLWRVFLLRHITLIYINWMVQLT